MWLTEDPWPLAIGLACAAAILGFAWYKQPARKFLGYLAIVAVVLGATVLTIERFVVTEAERVELFMYELADQVRDNRVAGVLKLVDDDAKELKAKIRRGFDYGEVKDDLSIKQVDVKLTAADRALVKLRVNGTVREKLLSTELYLATRWRMVLRKTNGKWKITIIERLDPIRDDTIEFTAN